jgi:hypothetical protein
MAERTGKQLAIYLPAELYDRLDASAKRWHRTKTVQVVLALEAFLAADEAAAGIDGKAPAPALPQDATEGKASQTPGDGEGKRQRGKGAKGKAE